jgi:hypothetical protein
MKKSAIPDATAALPIWAAVGDAGKDQLAAANDCAAAMFSGFEAMRKVQEHIAHDAARRHHAAAQKMKNGCTPQELATIQGELMRSDAEMAAQYWQQLAATAMEMQTRMMGAWNGAVDAGTLLESLSAIAGRAQPH